MSAVEWVREDDWSTVEVGQRVRLEATFGQGDFAEITVMVNSPSNGIGSRQQWFRPDMGWTLYVTPPPTPELPTEPGTVITWKNGAYLDAIAQKCPEGRLGWWADFGQGGRWHTDAELLAVIEETEHTPLTRLAQVPDTARQVLDRLSEVSIKTTGGRDEDHRSIFNSSWDSVAAEFGVTEP